jgi:putative peptidoglycan lipid II flippase
MAGIFGRGIRLSLFIALPASVGLMFVARPLVATLYQRGAFDAGDTQRVAATLFFYSIGVVAYFAQHILVRTFYALHSSSAPARIALCMVGVNFAMNLSLVFILEERGLALATAVCAVVQVIWLSTTLARTLPEIGWRRIGAGVLRMLVATGIMAAALSILAWSGLTDRLIGESAEARLAALVLTGIAIYAIAARVLRIEELYTVLRQKRRPLPE